MNEREGAGAPIARYAKAYALYEEILTVQTDYVRAAINLDGQREVFYRLPPHTHSVKVFDATPSRPADKENFLRFGFTEEDIDTGIVSIMEQRLFDPEKRIYDAQRATPLTESTWTTKTGKILRYDSEKQQYIPGELSTYAPDALRRITRLQEIPDKIKEDYGSFGRFKEELGEPDTNGLDHYSATGGENSQWPWVPFKGEGLLPAHVRKAKPHLH